MPPRRGLSRRRAFLRGVRGALAPLQGWQNAKPRRSAPSHPGSSPRPEIPASGQTSPTRRICGGSRGSAGGSGLPAVATAGADRVPRRAAEPFRLAPPGGTEADGDLEELAGLRSVFAACEPLREAGAREFQRAVGGAARAAGRRRGRLRRLEADRGCASPSRSLSSASAGRPRGTAPWLGAARTRLGPTPGTARRTRATRTRRRLWPPPGTRRALARLGRTSRHDSGTRPSSSPGACVVWRAGGGGGVSCPPRGAAISPSYTAERAALLVSL